MEWTKEPPTEPGMYWLAVPGKQPEAVRHDGAGILLFVGSDSFDKVSAPWFAGAFWCPIAPPPWPWGKS